MPRTFLGVLTSIMNAFKEELLFKLSHGVTYSLYTEIWRRY